MRFLFISVLERWILSVELQRLWRADTVGAQSRARLAAGLWGGKQVSPWQGHDMETRSVLLALYEGNPPPIGGFPWQRARNVEPWFFFFDANLK